MSAQIIAGKQLNGRKEFADIEEDELLIVSFNHNYIQLTDDLRQAVIDYLDWLENRDSPSS